MAELHLAESASALHYGLEVEERSDKDAEDMTQPNRTRILEVIEKCDDPAALRRIMKNAKERVRGDRRGAEARRGRRRRGLRQVRAHRLAGARLHQWVIAATHHHPVRG